MNSQYLLSKAYLIKKFQIVSEQQLYLQLSKRYTYPICNKSELFHYILFLSLSVQRRKFGDPAKFKVIELLNQEHNYFYSVNLEQQISLLLGLSNLLIYDEKLLQSICEGIQKNLSSIKLRDRLQIAHSLQKLRMEKHSLFTLISNQLNNQFEFLDHFDQIVFLLIYTRLYNENIVSQQVIEDQLKYFINQKKETIQNFTAQLNYRYCQIIFDLFPEVLVQNYENVQISQQNQFYPYFQKLKRNYIIARKVIESVTGYQKADYFEYQNINFLKMPIEENEDKFTNLEFKICEVLQSLNIQFKTQKRILIYDVDILLQNNTIINCNGPFHFIMNLQQQQIGYSPNHETVIRHLKLGQYNIIGIDFEEWNKQISLISKQNYLRSLINNQ